MTLRQQFLVCTLFTTVLAQANAGIARNILVLSLLLDDKLGSKNRHIWNIYYHLYLDSKSLRLVQSQAKMLHTLSASIQSWHDSKYGRVFRLCDQGTFEEIREIWRAYNTADLSVSERKYYLQRFKLGIQRAVDMQSTYFGSGKVGLILTGCRSAAPTTLQSMVDVPELHQYFWDHGITDNDDGALTQAMHPNPMFAPLLTDNFTLHYGTDPFLGFQLATAYVPLISGSPLCPTRSEQSHLHRVVKAARLQFREWGESFRQYAEQNLILRFIAGDALALCHTLQHRSASGDGDAYWYRRQYSLEPLVLDGQDYAARGNAPLTFNVIDTSNLADHVGAINLLVAASPLLDGSLSATLYVESLVRQEKDQQTLLDTLVCGHFASVCILLGVFPVEYWTYATATSTADEAILEMATRSQDFHKSQLYTKIALKRPVSGTMEMSRVVSMPHVRFDETELTRMLHDIYLKMFQHESMAHMVSNPDMLTLQNSSRRFYHRGTLAAFLSFVKRRSLVSDWTRVMGALLSLIANDKDILIGSNYIQELYLQLHLLDVYSVETMQQPTKLRNPAPEWKGMNIWKNIPPVVCITLKVPRTKLKVFTDLPGTELGTPPLHCLLQSTDGSFAGGWQNIFAVVQLAFGEVRTSGSRHDQNFHLDIVEDKRGWKGSSPLLISFYAPSWPILREGPAITVAFGVQTTPQSTMTFFKVLGVEMSVYKTKLGNEDDVFVTANRPNQKEFPSLCSSVGSGNTVKRLSSHVVSSTTRATFDAKTSQITTITSRLNIISEDIKLALRKGCQVETIQISPTIIAVILGGSNKQHFLHFPAPVLQGRSKCRIARKSFYVEVEAPLSSALGVDRFPRFMCPVYGNGQDPVLWNMPRLNLDRLPKIDTAKTKDLEWLTTHTSLMWSFRERKLRGRSGHSSMAQEDLRINFKDSLFSMFMHYTGLQGRQANVFGISNPTAGGIHIIFFVSSLRLDLSNRTVVLDAAALPLSDQLMPNLDKFLGMLTEKGICSIKAENEEMNLWKEMLPPLVERCRQWKHRPTCEYLGESRIPLSIHPGRMTICSCGNGTIPKEFISDIPLWDTVSKYAVRVAISPIFTPPFVEPVHDMSGVGAVGGGLSGNQCATCGKKGPPSNKSKLQKCGRCMKVAYCSVKCQQADWKQHKRNCAK